MTAASRPQRGRPKDESLPQRRREQILDAATTVFARDGYPNTDVQVIADQLALSKGTVYRYFPTKQGLFFAAVDRGIRRLHDAVTAAGARGVRPARPHRDQRPRLPRLLQGQPRTGRAAHPGTRGVPGPQKIGLLRAPRRQARAVARTCWPTWSPAGRLRDVPVERIVDVVGDLLYGTMFTNHFAGRHKPHEAQAEDILDVVFHGILSEPNGAAAPPGVQRRPT